MTDSREAAAPPEPPLGYAFIVAVWLVAAFSVARYLPHLISLVAVTVGDPGWPLAVDALVGDGLVPTVDFGYFYGLLTIAIDRGWFAMCGRTPAAVAALTVLGCALLTQGLLRFARAARLGKWQRVLFVCAVPVAVMPLAYPTPLHAIEAALLVHALASQARGRLATALVFATLAVFVKPALGYFQGLALLLLLITGRGGAPATWRERGSVMLPAALVGMALAMAFAIWFGIEPLLTTLFPVRAVQNYGNENFGFFFGSGREFWIPIGNPFTRYLLFPAGFWLLATLLLTLGALRRLTRLRDPLAASVVTAAFLHLVFVCFLFGNQWSWMYYSALLVCGLCVVVRNPGRPEASDWPVPLGLAFLAVIGMIPQTVVSIGFLARWERSTATANLYAEADDVAAWQRWRELGQHQRVLVFGPSGGTFVVFPELDSPRAWFLLKSTTTPREIERVQEQLREADYLIVSTSTQYQPPVWPEFTAEWQQFDVVEESPSFKLLHRRTPR